MEMKNKDQETQVPGHLWNEEDQKQSRAEKNRSGSSSLEKAIPSSNQEYQLNFQLPCSNQANVEETTPLVSKFKGPSPPRSPLVPGQWPNSQVQNGHLPPHLIHACMPYWPAQQPWYIPEAANGTCKNNGDFSPGCQQPLPCYPYPISCPYPGFPGTYGPWRGQPQPMPLVNAGSDGHFASSSFPGCFATGAPSNQRDIIQHPAYLLEKHQQRLDAQSEENVQLWNVIGILKSELAEYKTRLTKLEKNSLSPKPNVKDSFGDSLLKATEDKPAGNLSLERTEKELSSDLSLKQTEKEPGGEMTVSLQGLGKRKRGRPRRQSAFNNTFIPFLDKSNAKDPAMPNAQRETRS